jgi:hypothetical protein
VLSAFYNQQILIGLKDFGKRLDNNERMDSGFFKNYSGPHTGTRQRVLVFGRVRVSG